MDGEAIPLGNANGLRLCGHASTQMVVGRVGLRGSAVGEDSNLGLAVASALVG